MFEQPQLEGEDNERSLPILFSGCNQNIHVEDGATVAHGSGGKGYGIVECNLNDASVTSSYTEWKVQQLCQCVVMCFCYQNRK